MDLKHDIKEKVIKENKTEQLIDAQFGIIDSTGKISGYVKNILYLEDKTERVKSINKVEEELSNLIEEIISISDALRIDLKKIVTDKMEE